MDGDSSRPGHRVRRPRPRDRRADEAEWLVGAGRPVPAARTPQPTRTHSRGCPRSHRGRTRAVRADLRRLRRLRHRRPARRSAAGRARGAPAGRALLRVLRHVGGVCSDERGGARHVLPDGFPGATLRQAGHRRARHRPAPGTGRANTSATTASSRTWCRSRIRRLRAPLVLPHGDWVSSTTNISPGTATSPPASRPWRPGREHPVSWEKTAWRR